MHPNTPEQSSLLEKPVSRRDFLKIASLSAAVAPAVAATVGCGPSTPELYQTKRLTAINEHLDDRFSVRVENYSKQNSFVGQAYRVKDASYIATIHLQQDEGYLVFMEYAPNGNKDGDEQISKIVPDAKSAAAYIEEIATRNDTDVAKPKKDDKEATE